MRSGMEPRPTAQKSTESANQLALFVDFVVVVVVVVLRVEGVGNWQIHFRQRR